MQDGRYGIKCFVEKLYFLLSVNNGKNNDIAWNFLQKQFIELQCEDSKLEDKNIDEVIGYIQNIHSVDGNQK